MCIEGKGHLQALHYLRTDLATTVNHDDAVESSQFRALTSSLFKQKNIKNSGDGSKTDESGENSASTDTELSKSTLELRSNLFEELSQYFPAKMLQPSSNIVDLIKM